MLVDTVDGFIHCGVICRRPIEYWQINRRTLKGVDYSGVVIGGSCFKWSEYFKMYNRVVGSSKRSSDIFNINRHAIVTENQVKSVWYMTTYLTSIDTFSLSRTVFEIFDFNVFRVWSWPLTFTGYPRSKIFSLYYKPIIIWLLI